MHPLRRGRVPGVGGCGGQECPAPRVWLSGANEDIEFDRVLWWQQALVGTTQCCCGDGARAWESRGSGILQLQGPPHSVPWQHLQLQWSRCLCLSQGTHCAPQPMAEAEGSVGAGGAEEPWLITEHCSPVAFCHLAGTLQAGLRWLVVPGATEQPQLGFSACPLV